MFAGGHYSAYHRLRKRTIRRECLQWPAGPTTSRSSHPVSPQTRCSLPIWDEGLQRRLWADCWPFVMSVLDFLGTMKLVQTAWHKVSTRWVRVISPGAKTFLSDECNYCNRTILSDFSLEPFGADAFWLLLLIMQKSQWKQWRCSGSHECWIELAGTSVLTYSTQFNSSVPSLAPRSSWQREKGGKHAREVNGSWMNFCTYAMVT